MATVKSFNTGYILKGPVVTITGNLTVLGNTTTVNSNNITLTDNVIVLNNGEAGAGVTKGNAGIVVNRGSLTYTQLQWNEAGGQVWQISDVDGNYSNILSSPFTRNVSSATFAISGTPNVIFSSNLQLNNVDTLPSTAVTNATLVFASAPGSAGSGLYVTNSGSNNQELVTKSKAIVYALIL